MASRKDFIEIAEGCINSIKRGYVKKKDIDYFINTISDACYRTNNNFQYGRFETYVKKGLV